MSPIYILALLVMIDLPTAGRAEGSAGASADAASIADELRHQGFEVTALSDGTRAQMFEAMRAFRETAERSEWAVVYYAGHGMELNGRNYLIPSDARLHSDKDVEDEAVPLDRGQAAAEDASHLRLVILDACRDNPFLASMKRSASLHRSVSRGLARVEPDAGRLVVYAAKEGETAEDGEAAHGPFATALLKEMRMPDLEVRRLFDYVREDVLEATGRRQMPFSYGSLPARENFYFVGSDGK